MKLIIKSIFMLSKEKLCVLADEVDFIYDICNYYKGDGSNEASLKKDLEENFKNLKKQLVHISNEIIKIDSEISNHLNYKDQDERELLFFIDYYTKKINKIIQQLKLINSKTSQMFRDGYNQYIPKPTPGRMISNINMTSQVEESLEKRLNSFFSKNSNEQKYQNNLSAQIIWEYAKSYKITTVKSIKNDTNVNFNIAFFRMSYWYFDLPYLIPAITHEISHIALKNKKYSNYVNKIKENVKKDIFNSKKDSLFKKKQIDVLFVDNIINEVLADIFSLIHHGTSYILTMSHELLGYYFASTFEYDSNKNINIASWVFNEMRDRSYIRLSVLLSFYKLIKKVIKKEDLDVNSKLFSSNEKYLKEIEELLSIVYSKECLDTSKRPIKDYYKHWHNYLPEFEELEAFILFFIDSLNNQLVKEKDWFILILNNTKKHKKTKFIFKNVANAEPEELKYLYIKTIKTCKIPKFYNDLWEKRFEKLEASLVPHKSELRKKVHRDTICYLISKGKLKLDEIKPYILTFYKYKIDTGNRKNDKLDYEATLGIYDRVKIKLEEEFREPIPKKIDTKKKRYEKYTLNFSLMKILSDINGNEKKQYLNMIIQMEIKKDLISEDTYKGLADKLVNLHEKFEVMKDYFGKVEFFKSLGPKDIILRIENLSIDSVYEIKSILAKEFDRTFTTISYSTQKQDNGKNTLESIKSTEIFSLSTELRISPDGELKIPKIFKEHINKCLMIPGSVDYRIEWAKGTSLNIIELFYDEMIENQNISDIQTSFIKDVSENNVLFYDKP